MRKLYRISIAEADSPDIVTATVELEGNRARIVEVRSGEGDSPVPSELGEIDFSLLVRAAAVFSAAPETPSKADGEIAPATAPPSESVEQTGTGATAKPAHGERLEKNGMPSDFPVNFWRLGSVPKVAKHYDVPHRIAQDWVKTLQREGKAGSRWSKKSGRP
ncbi:hypothetical protein [Nocardia sienata]|uniref:hypothetical protein n=1 Tax=Nocardia sienata TaxID=248552 RepID=UPI0007A42063|nr:hypothetical protein [Nocardia sienata]